MKRVFLRATAWLMALFVTFFSVSGIAIVEAAEEKVLIVTAEMEQNGTIAIGGGTWDRIVVPRTTEVKKVLLNGVITKSLVVESGMSCIVEVNGGEIVAVTVTPPQLEVIGYEEIVKMLEEEIPAEEVAQMYRFYTEEKERLGRLSPTIVIKEEAEIKTVQISGNVKLELGEGNVGGVKIGADGVQELLNIRIAGYSGKVDVEQQERPDGAWSVLSLSLENSDLEELNIAGTKGSSCYVEGRTSNVKKMELAGQTSLTMSVNAEEVRLGSEAENTSLKVYSKVGSITVEGDKNSVSLAASAKVEKAEVKGDSVKIYGSGQLGEADITGNGANISTSGTVVEGANDSTPPAGSTSSSPVRPVVTPKPEATPTPKPTEVPEVTPTEAPEATPTPKPTGMPEVTPTEAPEATPTPKPTEMPEEPEIPETDASMFAYEVNEEGTITITGFSEAGQAAELTEISIPKLIEGKQVTHIDIAAFDSVGLRKLALPEGLVEIGDSAFGGSYDGLGISNVKLPSTLRVIGSFAFDGMPLQTVLIPESVEVIGEWAFSGVKESIEVEKGNRFYTSVDGVLFNADKTMLMQMPVGKGGSYVIPNTVDTIAQNAFGNSKLSSVTIPKSVTTIEEYAFSGASNLRSLFIPDTVSFIGGGAFGYCSGLSSFEVAEENARYVSKDGVLYSKDGTILCELVINASKKTEFVIPDSVTEIGDNAFSGCFNLVNVMIPDSVFEIGNNAFSGCRSLESVEIPYGVTKIGTGTFNGCFSLANIMIPDSVSEIGNYAFNACRSLESVEIPYGVTKIGTNAFNGCFSLANIMIPDSVSEIGNNAFRSCRSLESVEIPYGVTQIGNAAFNGCDMLTFVDIAESVEVIGSGAFFNVGSSAAGTGTASGSAVTVVIRGAETEMRGTAFNGVNGNRKDILFKVKEGSKIEALLRKQRFENIEYLP